MGIVASCAGSAFDWLLFCEGRRRFCIMQKTIVGFRRRRSRSEGKGTKGSSVGRAGLEGVICGLLPYARCAARPVNSLTLLPPKPDMRHVIFFLQESIRW